MASSTELPAIRRVAIVGAGAGGLVAARALLEEKCFDAIDIFEQRSDVGGVWNYTPQTGITSVPSTNPHVVEPPVKDGEKQVYVSAIYDSLEANLPKPLMAFPKHPFPDAYPLYPEHQQVLSYLRAYAEDLRHLITFDTAVTSITPAAPGWTVETTRHPPGRRRRYDAVVVATGHYNTPYIPSLAGITSFPGNISHSRDFRRPEVYAGKRVLLVGNSLSALDIAAQLLPFVKAPLLQVIRSPPSSAAAARSPAPGISRRPEISALHADGAVSFVDGTREEAVDVVLFATGYLYTLPFLSEMRPSVVSNGNRVQHTFKHVFYAPDPTLSFVCLPTRIVPFPLSQSQGAWIARVYSGRLKLPPREQMEAWERDEIAQRGDGRGFPFYSYPRDADYMDELEGLVGEGEGLAPAKWRGKERWVRGRVPEIKRVYASTKATGRVVHTMEELGFVYPGE